MRHIKSTGGRHCVVFSVTHLKAFSRSHKKNVLPENTANPHSLRTKDWGGGSFLCDVLPEVCTLVALFPLIAPPSAFLIESHILLLPDMGATNKVQNRAWQASGHKHCLVFDGALYCTAPGLRNVTNTTFLGGDPSWRCESQVCLPTRVTKHLLRPQPQEKEGFIYQMKTANRVCVCVCWGSTGNPKSKTDKADYLAALWRFSHLRVRFFLQLLRVHVVRGKLQKRWTHLKT